MDHLVCDWCCKIFEFHIFFCVTGIECGYSRFTTWFKWRISVNVYYIHWSACMFSYTSYNTHIIMWIIKWYYNEINVKVKQTPAHIQNENSLILNLKTISTHYTRNMNKMISRRSLSNYTHILYATHIFVCEAKSFVLI